MKNTRAGHFHKLPAHIRTSPFWRSPFRRQTRRSNALRKSPTTGSRDERPEVVFDGLEMDDQADAVVRGRRVVLPSFGRRNGRQTGPRFMRRLGRAWRPRARERRTSFWRPSFWRSPFCRSPFWQTPFRRSPFWQTPFGDTATTNCTPLPPRLVVCRPTRRPNDCLGVAFDYGAKPKTAILQPRWN